MKRAGRAVCHLYDLVLAPTQLRATQFTVLRTIAEAGEIAHCDLARQLSASRETFSRRLASASRNGWVSMRLGPGQRRVYKLTDEGLRVLRQATPYWERAQNRLRRELGDGDWENLAAFAERLTQAAARGEQAPVKNHRPRSLASEPASAPMADSGVADCP